MRSWKWYKRLKAQASAADLLALSSHSNPEIRCYAFLALAARRADQTYQVLLGHLKDTAYVTFVEYDVGWKTMVGDVFFNIVKDGMELEQNFYRLSAEQRREIDSILICDPSILLSERSSVIRLLEPAPRNYAMVRRLAEKERNGHALVNLAGYRKAGDRQLIATFSADSTRQYFLNAIKKFPDDLFYPYLKNMLESDLKEERYYDGMELGFVLLADYPRQETVDFFNRIASMEPRVGYPYQVLSSFLVLAITRHPLPLYEPIRKKISLGPVDMDQVNERLKYY